jgi:predicted peptidase
VEQFIEQLVAGGLMDATADAAMATNIRDAVAMGDLNEVCLEGYGVNVWYRLPEGYSPAGSYPLFVYNHGSGECWDSVVDGGGDALDNGGVHFNIAKVAAAWATTGEHGLSDAIVLCVQYLNGNNGANLPYDRDDAIRAGMFYMIQNFAVDRERVYASGTSQGAGRTSALVRDCADWVAAAIIQNGGYSSAISNYGVDRAALATLWSTDDCTELAVKIHEYLFAFAAEQGTALWFFQGENDAISRPLISLTMYKAFRNMYERAGKGEAWIADNLRYTMFDNVVYDVIGETSYHSSLKPTYHWYAYYDDAAYEAVYAGADGTERYGDRADPANAALNNYDALYGANDPGGYSGLIDWTLRKTLH